MIEGSKLAVWIYLLLGILNAFFAIYKDEPLCFVIMFLSFIVSASQAYGVKGVFQ